MRFSFTAIVLALAVPFACPVAAQDNYPTKPVTLVVPSPAGGTTDVVARIFAKKLQEIMGQPFLVDNRAGANGYIGTQSVLRSPKEGYQLVVMSGSLHSFTPAMVEKMPFEVARLFRTFLKVDNTFRSVKWEVQDRKSIRRESVRCSARNSSWRLWRCSGKDKRPARRSRWSWG